MKAGPTTALLVALVLVGLGCDKNTKSLSSDNAKLFQTADPQIKAQWDTAVAAIGTNGFLVAMVSLQKLQKANLTSEQLVAVNETVTSVSNDMYDAANKGDARAQEAISSLRKLNAR